MKVWIKMTQREGKTAEVLCMIWLALLLVSIVTPLAWKWFLSYMVIGFITFIVFGEIKYHKGNYKKLNIEKEAV